MLWLKAFHVISIVCWFAGLFYLPRLFVYHALATDQATRDHLKIMERKLYRFTSPFALFALVFGVAMVLQNPDYYLHARWLHIKLLLVFFLYGYHGHCGKLLKQFARDDIRHSHVYYRWFNEAPALLLFAIVILAVVKPW
jgi:protoporphyrinogen IX oxidase